MIVLHLPRNPAAVVALALGLFVAIPGASAQDAAPQGADKGQAQRDAQRARIGQLRTEADARHARDLADCSARFAVTDCTQKADRTHRETLADLRRQQVVLDNEERRLKGAERLRKIEQRSAKDPTPEPPRVREPKPSVQPSPRPAREPRPGQGAGVPRESAAQDAQRARRQDERSQREARSVRAREAYEAKQRAAQRREEQARARQQEKASRPAAKPLPPPPN